MAISNIIITFVLKQTIAGNEELVRSYIDTSPLLMIFSTVIYAPICEELTFRKSIKDAINNKYIYILTSGLLFGFLHIVRYKYPFRFSISNTLCFIRNSICYSLL